MKTKKADGLIEPSKLKALLNKFAHPGHVTWMRTGIHAVDLAIGGGIPLGRVIEIFGSESAGKSLLAWTILRAFQQNGGVGIVFDVEATAPTEFMTKLGINIDDIVYEKPETIEQIQALLLDRVKALRGVDAHMPIVAIWDSIAGTSADEEWEEDSEHGYIPKENAMGRRAAALSKFFKMNTIWLTEQNVTLIAVNQLRDKLGVLFGRKTESPGGHALRHHASVRIELTRGKKYEVAESIAGVECYLRIDKNKVAPPFRKATLRVDWNKGFNAVAGLEDILDDAGRIKLKKAGTYSFGEEEFHKKDIAEFAATHPTILDPWI